MRSSGSAEVHRLAGSSRVARCAVLTVSDTRTLATDRGGDLAVQMLLGAGHELAERSLVRDEPLEIEGALDTWLAASTPPDLIVTTGGTGIGPRDGTVELVVARLDKVLDGFGELFRMLSYEQIGAAAMVSRAVLGLAGRSFIVALPGSPAAVELALGKLVVPELGHLLAERDRRPGGEGIRDPGSGTR